MYLLYLYTQLYAIVRNIKTIKLFVQSPSHLTCISKQTAEQMNKRTSESQMNDSESAVW